jgi:acyl carrier protein
MSDDVNIEPYRDNLEEAVASVFKTVLGLESVDPNTSFFELGGHSLEATRLINLIRSNFKKELTFEAFFAGPTVSGVALSVEKAEPSRPSIVAYLR